jgi:hypothetical protein
MGHFCHVLCWRLDTRTNFFLRPPQKKKKNSFYAFFLRRNSHTIKARHLQKGPPQNIRLQPSPSSVKRSHRRKVERTDGAPPPHRHIVLGSADVSRQTGSRRNSNSEEPPSYSSSHIARLLQLELNLDLEKPKPSSSTSGVGKSPTAAAQSCERDGGSRSTSELHRSAVVEGEDLHLQNTPPAAPPPSQRRRLKT